MFKDFYGLTATPFTKGPPSFGLFMTDCHLEALARLVYVVEKRKFAVVTGDCGNGKSTLLRKLSESLDDRKYEFLYLADSKMTPRNLYNSLLCQLGREGAFYRGDCRRKLHQEVTLLQGLRRRELVVAVDEAHLLDQEMLEEIRLLLNHNMDSENPLSLILCGQPELETNLCRRRSEAIKQRIDFHCRLQPMTQAETAEYIKHHLTGAGASKPIFLESAVREIYSYSAGSARLVNKACYACLIFGHVNKLETIGETAVVEVIESELK